MRNKITFRDHSSDEFSIVLTSEPSIGTPVERGETVTIPGRNGSIFMGEGAFDPFTITFPIYVPRATSINAVKAWLSGSGDLYIGDDDEAPYNARVSQDIQFVPLDFYNGWTATVTFEAQPFRTLPGGAITITTSPKTINNAYDVFSEPLMAVTCTGDFSITVNGTNCTVEGQTGVIYIDSELQEVYKGTTLLNDSMDGAFPIFAVGSNVISYTGAITQIVITPRWRIL